MKVERSDDTNFIVVGINFYVSGTFSENAGWTAHIVVCHDGDDLLKIPPKERIERLDDQQYWILPESVTGP